MDVSEHIATLETEGIRLVEATCSAELTAPVPSCPAWSVRDLLAHIGYVHRWAASYVRDGLTQPIDEAGESEILATAPPDETIRAWAREGHSELVDALQHAPADLQCWTFLEAPSPLAMWARRQAHETTIHRVDAELAAAIEPSDVDPGFAVDGIDELLFAFFRRPMRPPAQRLPLMTVGLDPVDRGESW